MQLAFRRFEMIERVSQEALKRFLALVKGAIMDRTIG